MSRALDPIDLGVVIERVRVRVQPQDDGASLVAEPPPRGARAGDHRIVVGELCIDTDAALDGFEARRLGERVARALGEDLAELQVSRLDAILFGRSRGGPVRIAALRAVLRGEEAEEPNVRAIALALTGAVERRLVS
jgi:hypothetical protein